MPSIEPMWTIAPLRCSLHERQDRAGAEEGADQVDVLDAPEDLGRRVLDRPDVELPRRC
jgi:hypothetical protein